MTVGAAAQCGSLRSVFPEPDDERIGGFHRGSEPKQGRGWASGQTVSKKLILLAAVNRTFGAIDKRDELLNQSFSSSTTTSAGALDPASYFEPLDDAITTIEAEVGKFKEAMLSLSEGSSS